MQVWGARMSKRTFIRGDRVATSAQSSHSSRQRFLLRSGQPIFEHHLPTFLDTNILEVGGYGTATAAGAEGAISAMNRLACKTAVP